MWGILCGSWFPIWDVVGLGHRSSITFLSPCSSRGSAAASPHFGEATSPSLLWEGSVCAGTDGDAEELAWMLSDKWDAHLELLLRDLTPLLLLLVPV